MSQRLTLQMGSESSKTLAILPDGRIEMDGAQIVRGEHPVHGFGAEGVGAEEVLADFGTAPGANRTDRQDVARDVLIYACRRLGIAGPTALASAEIRRICAINPRP